MNTLVNKTTNTLQTYFLQSHLFHQLMDFLKVENIKRTIDVYLLLYIYLLPEVPLCKYCKNTSFLFALVLVFAFGVKKLAMKSEASFMSFN
jgi:hypothetical protein